jgi:hypothetical protein
MAETKAIMEATTEGTAETMEEMEEKALYQNRRNTHQTDGGTILYILKQKVKQKQNQK